MDGNNGVRVYKSEWTRNLAKGQKAESVFDTMLETYYSDKSKKIINWDFNTIDGKIMEKRGIDHTIILNSDFELHTQLKANLYNWGCYVELYKSGKEGDFLKAEDAHRWYHFNKKTYDMIYYDLPKMQNFIVNTIIKNKKYIKEMYQDGGTTTLCKIVLNDNTFKGRYTYLKYLGNGKWRIK